MNNHAHNTDAMLQGTGYTRTDLHLLLARPQRTVWSWFSDTGRNMPEYEAERLALILSSEGKSNSMINRYLRAVSTRMPEIGTTRRYQRGAAFRKVLKPC